MSLARRTLAAFTALSLIASGSAHAGGAALIGTEQLAAAAAEAAHSGGHARLHAALDRADLAAALEARGVAPESLRARIDALTDAEAAALVRQIDSAPAGADVIGVLFTVFIILLVTDILGLTKVFPFTRSVR